MLVQTRVQKKTYDEMIQEVMIEFLAACHPAQKTHFLRNAFRIQIDCFDNVPGEVDEALVREIAIKTHPLKGRFNIRASFSHLTSHQAQELEGWMLWYHYANTADSSAFYTVMNNCFTADSFKVLEFPLVYYNMVQEMSFSYPTPI